MGRVMIGMLSMALTLIVSAGSALSAGEESPGEREAIALYRQGQAAEAVAAFDRLLAERPNDDGLKIWKALGMLEQARAMRESSASGYKPLVVNAYSILKPLGKSQEKSPDWNFAVAKAFWLNERPERAERVAKRVLALRGNSPEAHLLLGDIAYEEGLASHPASPSQPNAKWVSGLAARKAYETALGLPDLPSYLRAEALYKLGLVSAERENKGLDARESWEKAVAAAPDSRYGKMAQDKLAATARK